MAKFYTEMRMCVQVLLLADIDPMVATNGSRHATVMRVSMDWERTRVSSTMWTNPGPFEDSRILTRNITMKLWKVGKIMIDACEGTTPLFLPVTVSPRHCTCDR